MRAKAPATWKQRVSENRATSANKTDVSRICSGSAMFAPGATRPGGCHASARLTPKPKPAMTTVAAPRRPEAPRVRRVGRREHRVVRDRFHRLRQGVRVLAPRPRRPTRSRCAPIRATGTKRARDFREDSPSASRYSFRTRHARGYHPLRARPPSPPSGVSNRPKTRSTLPSHAFAFIPPLNRTARADQDRGPHQRPTARPSCPRSRRSTHLHDHRRRQGMPTSTSAQPCPLLARDPSCLPSRDIFFDGGANATDWPRDTPLTSLPPTAWTSPSPPFRVSGRIRSPSVPVAYAKAAVALTPEKVEELKAMREAYYAKIEATLESLKSRAVKLPAEVTAAVTAAIAEARARIEDAHLFEKVKAAYETVLAYPAVVAVLEDRARRLQGGGCRRALRRQGQDHRGAVRRQGDGGRGAVRERHQGEGDAPEARPRAAARLRGRKTRPGRRVSAIRLVALSNRASVQSSGTRRARAATYFFDRDERATRDAFFVSRFSHTSSLAGGVEEVRMRLRDDEDEDDVDAEVSGGAHVCDDPLGFPRSA